MIFNQLANDWRIEQVHYTSIKFDSNEKNEINHEIPENLPE